MRSRNQHQPSLPPMELRNPEREGRAFRKSEQPSSDHSQRAAQFRNSEPTDESLRIQEQRIAQCSVLYDRALKKAEIESQQIADLFAVSVSLVDKWRNPNERACPSFWQIEAHPIEFHLAVEEIRRERPEYLRVLMARAWLALSDALRVGA